MHKMPELQICDYCGCTFHQERTHSVEECRDNVIQARDEARRVAQHYLQGLWDEVPNRTQWKKDAIAKEIADHPWLEGAEAE